MDSTPLDKIEEAKQVIEKCKTESGFHASTQLYPELWVRDLVFSEDVLLRLGYQDTIRRHFEAFLKAQRENGRIPTVITTPFRRIFNQEFHFWISDGEILFLTGVMKYIEHTGDLGFSELHGERIRLCRDFIGGRLNRLGLIQGMDWRDALTNYRNKFLLANQVLLVQMYDLLREEGKSDELRKTIRDVFYSDEHGFYADSVWWNKESLERDFRFDCFGNSLAILNEVGSKASEDRIVKLLEGAKTQFGYRNIFPPYKVERFIFKEPLKNMNAFLRNGAVLRNRPNNYQNSTIWPFVESKIAKAYLKLGLTDKARETLNMLLGREGLNEWYSPVNGEPRGSREQLWSASAILEVRDALSSRNDS